MKTTNRKRKYRPSEYLNVEDEDFQAIEQAAIRSKTLPFMDSVMKISETMRLHEAFRVRHDTSEGGDRIASEDDMSRTVDAFSTSVEPPQSIHPTVITAGSLKRRYPRFCSTLNFNEEIVASMSPRSDVWLMQMIEGCYDDVMEASFKQVSANRKRKRCGLSLGALDAFSLVATRFIARIYRSVAFLYALHICMSLIVIQILNS